MEHHLILDELRMAAFLPELVAGICFMRFFAECELLQKLVRLFLFQNTEDFFCGKGLEIVDLLAQSRCLENTVHMIFQDDLAVDLHFFVHLAPEEGIKKDLYSFGAGEDG